MELDNLHLGLQVDDCDGVLLFVGTIARKWGIGEMGLAASGLDVANMPPSRCLDDTICLGFRWISCTPDDGLGLAESVA